MRTEQKFHLHPDGVFITKRSALIVIVLEPDLRKLAGVPGQIRRDPSAVTAENVACVESALVAGDELAAQTRHPTRFDAPQSLRVKAPVAQVLGGQTGGQVLGSAEPPVKRLRLQRYKRKSLH